MKRLHNFLTKCQNILTWLGFGLL